MSSPKDMTSILMGTVQPAQKTKPTVDVAKPEVEAPTSKSGTPHASLFLKPVGVTFLAAVCGKQPRQIEKRLVKCPVKAWTKYSGRDVPMYNFLEAMAYLIPPKGDIEEWFAQNNAASLPPYVNKMFWDSAHQRNRVMMASNDLWHTEDILILNGRVAMLIREATKLWIEDLPEKDLMTDAQYNALMKSVDRLMGEIQKVLVEQPRQTLSMSAHIEAELDMSTSIPSDEDRADE